MVKISDKISKHRITDNIKIKTFRKGCYGISWIETVKFRIFTVREIDIS